MLTPLLTPNEAADVLRLPVKGVHDLCRRGEPDFVRINGKERRFTEDQISAYIEDHTISRTDVDKKTRKGLRSPAKAKKSIEGGAANLTQELRDLCQ